MNTASNEVPIWNRVTGYTRALSRWIKSGRPSRDGNEIDLIYETHCKTCESHDESHFSCALCGCRVNVSRIAPFNKIAMGTEHCPAKKW